MSRIEVVFLAGLCLALVGVFLMVQAEALATRLEPDPVGPAVAVTNDSQRQGYQMMGGLLAVAGGVAMGFGSWRRAVRRQRSRG